MESSKFGFDYIYRFCYTSNRVITLDCGGSYIKINKWLKNQTIITNP